MLTAGWERPGTALGLYPEKQDNDPGGIESFFANIGRQFRRASAPSLSQARQFVRKVEQVGKELAGMTDAELAQKTKEVRLALRKKGFNDLTSAQSFALVREWSVRKLGMRHFDVQIIGGWAMLGGMVAEMETGEGKTLTATLPACTAALAGTPVHIVTVNDYLVKRDAEWMSPLYQALGLKVGTITEGMDFPARQESYRADITYCTNKQVAFDYLKDRLVFAGKRGHLQMQIDRLDEKTSRVKNLLLRGLFFAIVDEADSVLIDEARTPLIISKNSDNSKSQEFYTEALTVAEQLTHGKDFILEDRDKRTDLTDRGKIRVAELTEDLGGLWKGQFRAQELTTLGLNALHLYRKDQHYLVQEEKIKIIDEFTGRVMADRSWERGLHQMIEAKEGCPITGQRETLARISYQQFFRRYLRLAGMTGTVKEIAGEIGSVYGLQVMKVPTNRPAKRVRKPSRIFSNAEEKLDAVVDRVEQIHKQQRPILIGTRSVMVSELLSTLLTQRGLEHKTLNARQDKDEAQIVEQAGHPGRITVATNMAGRGTDIKLIQGTSEHGGLHVIASEPHEARRIDRQLYGRCGRQGDPGSFELFFSFDDELAKVFGPKVFTGLFKFLKKFNQPHSSFWDGWYLSWTQKAAERYNAKIRQKLMKLDKQINKLLAFSGQSE